MVQALIVRRLHIFSLNFYILCFPVLKSYSFRTIYAPSMHITFLSLVISSTLVEGFKQINLLYQSVRLAGHVVYQRVVPLINVHILYQGPCWLLHPV